MMLQQSDLQNIKEENIQAISIAEGGAMGAAGQVIILNNDGSIWKTTSVYEDGYISAGEVLSHIPSLANIELSMFSWYFHRKPNMPQGWQYVAMGAGNHLFVRPTFLERHSNCFDLENPAAQGLNYCAWQEIVTVAESN